MVLMYAFFMYYFLTSSKLFMSVIAIKKIEAMYESSRINWQGDPCVPQHFIWDGLNCSNTDISTPPRITSL